MNNSSKYLDGLIKEFAKFPGIGTKSASRFAFHVLSMPMDDVNSLTAAITELKRHIRACGTCGGISDSDTCSICSNDARDRGLLCVVEGAKDILTLEKTGRFNGLYHVLMGVISPLDGIGPDDLSIAPLLMRVKGMDVHEIVLAFNSSIEGDATTLYISGLFRGTGIKISRLAHGLPAGADLDFTDSATLIKSIDGRVVI